VLAVRGLAPADSDVLVYIDGQVAGIAETKNENAELSSFFFSPDGKLPNGSYEVSAVARDKKSYVVSGFSETKRVAESMIVMEKKEAPKVIPPTLLRSVVDKDSAYNRPKIIGQALAGMRVEVYVDDEKDGQIILDESRSGTRQFEYLLSQTLSAGQHQAYLYAFDKDDNRSERSNMIFINIASGENGKIEDGAAGDVKNEKNADTTGEKTIDPLQDILNYVPSTSTEAASGLIDEEKEGQSRLRMNLLVFLFFLVAIIGWIYWVNRELVKEKDKEEKNEAEAPIGDVDSIFENEKKNDAEYGFDKKKDKNDPDVLNF
jgi:hypothetical protein